MLFPATTVASPLLTIERSAKAVAVAVVVELLFPAVGSLVVEETFAVFEIVTAFAATLPVSVNVAEAPLPRVATEQVVVAVPLQLKDGPAVCDLETNVTPGGSVSVRTTFCASLGPLLTTVSV